MHKHAEERVSVLHSPKTEQGDKSLQPTGGGVTWAQSISPTLAEGARSAQLSAPVPGRWQTNECANQAFRAAAHSGISSCSQRKRAGRFETTARRPPHYNTSRIKKTPWLWHLQDQNKKILWHLQDQNKNTLTPPGPEKRGSEERGVYVWSGRYNKDRDTPVRFTQKRQTNLRWNYKPDSEILQRLSHRGRYFLHQTLRTKLFTLRVKNYLDIQSFFEWKQSSLCFPEFAEEEINSVWILKLKAALKVFVLLIVFGAPLWTNTPALPERLCSCLCCWCETEDDNNFPLIHSFLSAQFAALRWINSVYLYHACFNLRRRRHSRSSRRFAWASRD